MLRLGLIGIMLIATSCAGSRELIPSAMQPHLGDTYRNVNTLREVIVKRVDYCGPRSPGRASVSGARCVWIAPIDRPALDGTPVNLVSFINNHVRTRQRPRGEN